MKAMSHMLFNVSHIGLYIGVFVGICDTYGRTTLDIEGLLQIIKSIAKMGIVDQIIKLYIYIYISVEIHYCYSIVYGFTLIFSYLS